MITLKELLSDLTPQQIQKILPDELVVSDIVNLGAGVYSLVEYRDERMHKTNIKVVLRDNGDLSFRVLSQVRLNQDN